MIPDELGILIVGEIYDCGRFCRLLRAEIRDGGASACVCSKYRGPIC